MPANTARKYIQTIDYIDDFVGADIPRDLIKVAIEEIDDPAQSDGLPVDLKEIGNTDQTGADLMAILESVGGDEARIRLYAEDDAGNLAEIQAEELGTGLAGTETAVVTKLMEATEAVGNTEVRSSIYGPDDAGTLQEGQVEALNTGVAGGTFAQLTYLSRALNSQGLDEFISRMTDSSGTQIDPLTQDPTQAVGNTELRSRVFGPDSGGALQQVNTEAFDTALAVTDTGLATYMARALEGIGQDELRSRLHDSTGTQIDPSLATDYLDSQTTGYDLVASGDLTIGPGAVERGTAVTIAATSTDSNTFSVSVSWEDGSGNVFQTEAAADIGLDTITEDYARLVRKAPQVSITVTDESGAAQNIINLHADTER